MGNFSEQVWVLSNERHHWYIWAGEEFSTAPAFFEPRHLEHLGPCGKWLQPYLELAPGWRFLIAPDYEDVWFDEDLLRPPRD